MWSRLEKWRNNAESGITREKYLRIQEQLGKEPNPDKIPPDIDDFPEAAQEAIIIFNTLGDRIAADIGYLGKDYTLLPVYLKNVENEELVLEILAWLDSKVIAKSNEEMKKARDKMKRK